MKYLALMTGILCIVLISACTQQDRDDNKTNDTNATLCATDAFQCPDGSFVSRDSDNDCKFFPCPKVAVCTEEAKLCPDGAAVSRNPSLNCAFDPCPEKNECAVDSDCVKVAEGCCTCSSGGKARAMPQKEAQQWERNRAAQCKETACPAVISNDPSCKATPKCIKKQCVLQGLPEGY